MNPKFYLSLIALVTMLSATSFAQPQEIRLWPNGAPGSEGKSGAETVRVTNTGEHVVANVHSPSLTPYLPTKDQATGAAVIIAPGGGHREMWVDHEGHNLAKWLSAHGIAAFVLKYRLAREANSTYTIDDHAFADMQRAIRLVRSRAKEWNINPARVGTSGFSAGGELAALSGMRFDAGKQDATDAIERESSKPDFHALIYPGSSARYTVSKESPPVFIVCGYKDRKDIAEGMADVYLKFKQAGVPAELHIYAESGHGFGMRETTKGATAKWPQRFVEWMDDLGLLKR